jgi:hypothetical protein
MADYAPHHTPRLRVKYRVNGRNHSFIIRGPRGATTWNLQGVQVAQEFLDAMAPQLDATFTVTGADAAGTDSEVFLPAPDYPSVSGLSAVVAGEDYRPLFCSFMGRSAQGARAALFLFGFITSPNSADNTANDYRITSSESAAVQQAVVSLNNTPGGLKAHAIDGNPAVWYPYANVGFNAYYQRKARNG